MHFPLAAMDGKLMALTGPLLAVPGLLFVLASWMPDQADLFGAIGCALVAVYAGIWLIARPQAFVVAPEALVIAFPLRDVEVPREQIVSVEVYEESQFSLRLGGGMRIGAGGLWGSFGWVWTPNGPYDAYLSRNSDLVVVRCLDRRPLLLSPADPIGFATALGHAPPG